MARILAHRGASAIAPENTMEAFQKAVELGAHGIELDVHLSADGVLVVIHDEDILRTAGVKGLIPEMNMTQIKKVKVSNGFYEYPSAGIPLLQEVYELIRPTGLLINVEIKNNRAFYQGIEKKLLLMEKDMGMKGRILYSSFNHHTIKNIKAMDPKARTGVLYANTIIDPWNYANYLGAAALHPHYETVFSYPGYIERAHQNNLMVNAWTVDNSDDIRALISMGADGIITNRPNIAVEAMTIQR